MKKTLITTLLGISAVSAYAEVDASLVYTQTSGFTYGKTINTGTSLSTSHAYTLTVVLNTSAFSGVTVNNDDQKIIEIYKEGNQTGKGGIGLIKGSMNTTWETSSTGGGLYNGASWKVFYNENTALSNYDIGGTITLTMVRESSGNTTLYALTQDKTIATLGSYTATFNYPENHGEFDSFYINKDTGDLLNSIYVYNEAKDADGIKAASIAALNAAVPEPATTTLSLLALAGLAARRRRK